MRLRNGPSGLNLGIMFLKLLIYYFHYLAIFAVISGLVAAHLMLRKENTRAEIKRAWPVQMIILAGFALAIASGLLQWFAGEKAAIVYTKNGVFHTKLLLVVIAAALCTMPTMYLAKQRSGELTDIVSIPKPVMMSLRAQLLLVVGIIPFLALLMTRA